MTAPRRAGQSRTTMATSAKENTDTPLLVFDQASLTEPNLTTAGGTWKWTPQKGRWWNMEAYLQFSDGGGTAAMWVLDGGVQRDSGSSSRWGIDYLSGSGSSAAFQPLLGTNHKVLRLDGPTSMSGLPPTACWGGAPRPPHSPVFSQRAALGATIHHFRTPTGDALLGNELDVWLTGKHTSGVQWHVGWSLLDPTRKHVQRQSSLSGDGITNAAEKTATMGLGFCQPESIDSAEMSTVAPPTRFWTFTVLGGGLSLGLPVCDPPPLNSPQKGPIENRYPRKRH